MRIGIDARFYGTVGKGLGRHVSELIRQLELVDRENEYFVFLRETNWGEYTPRNPNFHKVLAEFAWYGLAEQLIYPFWLRRFRLDLMHFTHFNVPWLYRRPFVVTIHDLILLSHPTPRATTLGPLLFRAKYFFYRLIIRSAIARAVTIITVSRYTQDQIEQVFPFAKYKTIAVTYEACGSAFSAAVRTEARPAAPPPGLTRPFLLYVGNAYPHKNLERLLRAFADFRRRGHGSHHLILVGAQDYFYDRLQLEARKQKIAENIVFFGKASDAELADLYDTAEFYVFPSLCEGFGLPPLEAMCRGLAVASSKATCLPEILGDAALYFDPESETDMAQKLISLADDPGLRTELAAKGRTQTKKYDWNSCAAATLRHYQQALAKKQ
jgi:glycosyltransferase involved in cell wall biosynthesis